MTKTMQRPTLRSYADVVKMPYLPVPSPKMKSLEPENTFLPPEIKLMILKNLPEHDILKMRLVSRAWEAAANHSFFPDFNTFHFRPHRDNCNKLKGLIKTPFLVKNIEEIKFHVADFNPEQLLENWLNSLAFGFGFSFSEINKMSKLVFRSTRNEADDSWRKPPKHLATIMAKLPHLTKLTIDGWGCPWNEEEAISRWERLRDSQISHNKFWCADDGTHSLWAEQYTVPILAGLKSGRLEELVIDTIPVEVLHTLSESLVDTKWEGDRCNYSIRRSTQKQIQSITSLTIRARRGYQERYDNNKFCVRILLPLQYFKNLRSLTLDFPFVTGDCFKLNMRSEFDRLEFPHLENIVLGQMHLPGDYLRRWLFKHRRTLKKVGFMTNAEQMWSRDIFTEIQKNFSLEEFSCNHFATRPVKCCTQHDAPNSTIPEVQMKLIELFATRKIKDWPMLNNAPEAKYGPRGKSELHWMIHPYFATLSLSQLLSMDIEEVKTRLAEKWQSTSLPIPEIAEPLDQEAQENLGLDQWLIIILRIFWRLSGVNAILSAICGAIMKIDGNTNPVLSGVNAILSAICGAIMKIDGNTNPV